MIKWAIKNEIGLKDSQTKVRLTTENVQDRKVFQIFSLDIYKQSAYKQFWNFANVTIIHTITKRII